MWFCLNLLVKCLSTASQRRCRRISFPWTKTLAYWQQAVIAWNPVMIGHIRFWERALYTNTYHPRENSNRCAEMSNWPTTGTDCLMLSGVISEQMSPVDWLNKSVLSCTFVLLLGMWAKQLVRTDITMSSIQSNLIEAQWKFTKGTVRCRTMWKHFCIGSQFCIVTTLLLTPSTMMWQKARKFNHFLNAYYHSPVSFSLFDKDDTTTMHTVWAFMFC